MNPFFEYLIKSTISLSLLYLLFKAFMQNDKTLVLNRFLLLGILLFSAVIPLLNVQFFQTEVPAKQIETIRDFVTAPMTFSSENSVATTSVSESIKTEINYWLLIYGGVILILIIRLFLSVGKVLQLIQKAEKQKLKYIVLAVVKEMIQPFTFLNHVVLSEKDLREKKNSIVAHEQAHIKQLHAIDLAVCEVFTLLHFFNPLMWLLRRDLKLIHEYQADQAVLNNGIDAQQYQLLVLQKAVGERRFALANNFYQKPILKRIKMMKKNKKSWTQIKLLLFVPILLLLLQAFARPELISQPEEFIPVQLHENTKEVWLQKWTMQNIGEGIFQPETNSADSPKKPNNVLVILMNRDNEFLIENQHKKKEDIKQLVKNYLYGINPDGGKGPDYTEKEIPFIGKVKVSNGMVMYKHDIASSEEMINSTLKAIGEAYLEVRNEKAQIFFGNYYFELDEAKQDAVNSAVPVWFAYDKPKDIKNPPPPPPKFVVEFYKDRIILWDREVTLEELSSEAMKFVKKEDGKYYARVLIAVGVSDIQLNQLKEILNRAGVKNIEYSSDYKESDWTGGV
ncbi:Signal transducer regulating beta-lactamase production, contains metallopeptidase domain [Tangfeifania diversioriginum]|uniref:Signal transducer regulating beta-lactamase production, contains metallopeptidase domain n=1 Tax=Tangfeifania diversioriginum TaxID=1168035 RepID=A0A1M6A3F4_9BACT|nr:M56 family metallopeptidase [Tangfeifania diversioriginum]SHI30889.1 Signal transducer regulating beta-lactamase production, contains metallopeptidase domain [Tangfeifania diversioriginum]